MHMDEIMRDTAKCGYDGASVSIYEQLRDASPGAMTMYDYNLSHVLSLLDLNDSQRFTVEHTNHAGCHGIRLYIIKQ